MTLILLILVILLVFGGGGFYAGRGPAGAGWSGNPMSIILLVLMVCLIIAVLNHGAIGL